MREDVDPIGGDLMLSEVEKANRKSFAFLLLVVFAFSQCFYLEREDREWKKRNEPSHVLQLFGDDVDDQIDRDIDVVLVFSKKLLERKKYHITNEWCHGELLTEHEKTFFANKCKKCSEELTKVGAVQRYLARNDIPFNCKKSRGQDEVVFEDDVSLDEYLQEIWVHHAYYKKQLLKVTPAKYKKLIKIVDKIPCKYYVKGCKNVNAKMSSLKDIYESPNCKKDYTLTEEEQKKIKRKLKKLTKKNKNN